MLDETAIREKAALDGITHISTGVAIVKDGQILLVRRSIDDFLGGYYELPGGGVDDGETIEQAAMREVKEETGLVPSKVITTFEGFDYTTDRKPRVRQVNLIIEAKPGEVKLSSEHDDFLWANKNDLSNIKITENMVDCVNDAFAKLT
jgi:8-oxo-dGTP diphosphatase